MADERGLFGGCCATAARQLVKLVMGVQLPSPTLMKIRKFLVASGNPTILVWDCPPWKKQSVIEKCLPILADQIGFVSIPTDSLPKLEMMGNELCINATLALASQLGKPGQLYTSGIDTPVNYIKNSISLNLPYEIKDNFVLFPGIGYIVTNETLNPKIVLPQLSNQFKLPAFGQIKYLGNKINPIVYVKKTNSIVNESACGSGSIAFSLLNNVSDVIQPSGGVIKVQKNGSYVTISAKVTEIKLE